VLGLALRVKGLGMTQQRAELMFKRTTALLEVARAGGERSPWRRVAVRCALEASTACVEVYTTCMGPRHELTTAAEVVRRDVLALLKKEGNP
jgi:hypothetical protein